MSVHAFTKNPAVLLAKIKQLISQGHIRTWSCDDEGDFTHTPEQWRGKAWLRPKQQPDRLRLHIIASGITREVFAIYHGRFVEMLIKHVPEYFDSAAGTPNPSNDEPDLLD